MPTINQRTPQQIKEHYIIERELADKLRAATKEERRYLYSDVYNELFQRVPHHTQLTSKADPRLRAKAIAFQMKLLRHFINPQCTFLEIGAGDCKLTFEVAQYVEKAYAVEVSQEIAHSTSQPSNFELILSDGSSIPVAENSVDAAYSNQLMEHLHPDDASEQLQNIYKALSPGGVYICLTPSRISGPHDISKYFDKEATGFHLKEYTNAELASIFRAAGFSKVRVSVRLKNYLFLLPVTPVSWLEKLLDKWPPVLGQKKIARWLPINLLLGVNLVATK